MSPEKRTRSAPAEIPHWAVGSSLRWAPDRVERSGADVVDHPQVLFARELRELNRPDVFREADDPKVARVHPHNRGRLWADGPLVVRQPRLVGRADLAEDRARYLEDLGEPEAAADFDELPARDDHLTPGREGLQSQDRRSGVVIDGRRGLGPGQLCEQPRDALGAPASGPIFKIEFQVAITACDVSHGRDGFLGEWGTAQAGMEQHAGGVNHRMQEGPLALEDLA